MNAIDQATDFQRSDDLDEMLSAFYKSEMPHPWPALQLPAAEATLPLVRSERKLPSLWNSRFALAASVALLLLGTLLLSGAFRTNASRPEGTNNGNDVAKQPPWTKPLKNPE